MGLLIEACQIKISYESWWMNNIHLIQCDLHGIHAVFILTTVFKRNQTKQIIN